jgi:hypothetical protein
MGIKSRVWNFVRKEVNYEVERYRSTSILCSKVEYGKLFALFIYFLLFTLIPIFVRGLVTWLRNYFTDSQIYIILIVSSIFTVTLAWNVIMWAIYIRKMPFFEQYRCNPNVAFK